MAKLQWDQTGEHFFETGIDHVVLFVKKDNPTQGENPYETGVPWNGITAITESPSGAEPTAIYADNIKYLNLLSNEEFALTIEGLDCPDEFDVCNGSANLVSSVPGVKIGQQKRKQFAVCYRSLIGNDTDGADKGYQIHIVYNCLAAPSERAHNTVNDTPETMTLSWSVSTTPLEFKIGDNEYKTAHVVIDSVALSAITGGGDKLTAILNGLYGTDGTTGTDSKCLLPNEIALLINTP